MGDPIMTYYIVEYKWTVLINTGDKEHWKTGRMCFANKYKAMRAVRLLETGKYNKDVHIIKAAPIEKIKL